MNEIISTTLSRLRSAWCQILGIHLIYTGLGIILLAPLLGALGQMLVKLSAKPVLADMDLLLFALSPTGMIVFVLMVTVSVVLSVFELSSLMAIGIAEASGKTMKMVYSITFSLSRVRQIFQFATWLLLKILMTAAPFLLTGALVAFLLITDYDINYYLVVQPLEFWLAVIIIAMILVMMLAVLVRRLISWSLALPLVLFVGTVPTQSFAASKKLTQHNSRMILRVLIAWSAATLLLGIAATGAVQLLATTLAPLFMDSVTFLAILFGLLAILWFLIGMLITALVNGGLALFLATLIHRLEAQLLEFNPLPGQLPMFNIVIQKRNWFILVFIATAGISTLLGFILLDKIRIPDNAQLIAHRGAAGAAPENTLAAIRQAIIDGADWIEIAVQETADGEVVVFHDRDFMKLAGIDLKVWEANLKQLSDIDIGGWFAPEFAGERVPTLAAVLAEVKGRSQLLVELKYYGHDQQLEQRVIDLIEAAEMQQETMIMSMEYAGIQKVRALRPNWKIGLLSARAIGDVTRLDVDFLAVNLALAQSALLQAAHAAGKALYVWTVNDALAMSQMMSLGVDGIITDEPQLGREVLTMRANLSSVARLLLYVAPLYGLEAPSLSMIANDAKADTSNINFELSLHQKFQDHITSSAMALAEFSTDGCSGGLSVGWDYFAEQAGFFRKRHGRQPPWESCCVAHDRIYHKGGDLGLTAMESFSAREKADDELRACVLATASQRADQLSADYGLSEDQVAILYKTIADSMHMAVRLGGMPCTGLSWRWGYGWPECK